MSAQPSRNDIPIGVVVVTHTDYGTRLLAAAECIWDPRNAVRPSAWI
jgi:PTS system mannose-specific IIA component